MSNEHCKYCPEPISDHPRAVPCDVLPCIDCGELMPAEGDPIVCGDCLFRTNAPEMRNEL